MNDYGHCGEDDTEILLGWIYKKTKWNYLFLSLHEAERRLVNFKVSFSVQKREPLYGEIRFVHQDL